MSRETDEWLNNMTLIGYTETRGNAWHYRESLQGDEPNHYPQAIPIADVQRRLFNFKVVEVPLTYEFDGRTYESDRKLMVANDNGDLLGVFKDGYRGHDYHEWLIDKIASIIDDGLNVGSAGLLTNRARAWVSIEMPENMTADGVEFRPHLLAVTSFDGSLSTTYKRCVQFVVCDNTLDVGLGEHGQVFKVRHSKYSNSRLTDVRDALGIVHQMGDEFAGRIRELTNWKVTDKQFDRHAELMFPKPKDEGRALTIATKKQEQIIQLYRSDERAAPWRGTAFGVVQAYNTWQHHFQTVRGEASRAQRNMDNVINGRFAKQDDEVLAALVEVTGR